MRKFLSIMLSLAIIMSTFGITAFAAPTTKATYIDDTTGALIGNDTTSSRVTAYGVAGKASNDVSTFATRVYPNIDNDNANNHKIQYSVYPANKDFGDLTVFGVSFYSPQNISYVHLTGDGGVGISSTLSMSDERVQDGWNRIIYVYDHSTAGTKSGESGGKWAAFLNGECVHFRIWC